MKHNFLAMISVDVPDGDGTLDADEIERRLRAGLEHSSAREALMESIGEGNVTIRLAEEHPKERQAAIDNYVGSNGDIDVDDRVFLSPIGDDTGVWVSAWLFVHNEDL